MKVLYDYQGFFQRVGGISRCFCELAKHMPQNVEISFLIKESDNIYIKDAELLPDLPSCKLTFKNFLYSKSFKGKHMLYTFLENHFLSFPTFKNANKAYSIKKLRQGCLDFDVYHCTFYDDFFIPYLNGKPFVITVHDMIWELEKSERFSHYSHAKKNMANRANHIITVSQQTKNDLIRLWDIPEEKISVVYHGYPIPPKIYKESEIQCPYFLYVGRRGGYKNFKQTLIDFSIFQAKHKEVKLICVGSPFEKDEAAFISTLSLTGNVISTFATDNELYHLYHYAMAFIFPSTYEGFGIPILESFINGCVTLLNNSSCFPEIGGEAAIYFNSDGKGNSDLPEKMEYVYRLTQDERKTIIDKGFRRVEQFSWQNASIKLSEIYQALIQ